MNEIKKSYKGVDYATPYVLKKKKTVYSQAILMKIPHEHQENQEVTLKIGRYSYNSGIINDKMPKSELTLDNDELNNLVDYISSNYIPVKLGQGEYIKVQESDADLIQKFKGVLEQKNNVAKLLIDNDILSENIIFAATTIKRKEALNLFSKN